MGRHADRRGRRRPAIDLPSILPATLVALSLTVAACAPPADDAAPTPDRPPVVVDASLGVVRVAPDAPLLVRIVLDEGDPESLSAVLEAAFRAAVEDFGAVQQDFRVDLGTATVTDCSEEDGARVGAELAGTAEADGLIAVLGPQCTETLLGLQGPAGAAGLVVVAPRTTLPTLTEGADGLIGQDRADGTWRTVPSALTEARAGAAHAATDLGATRAVVVEDGTIVGAGLAAAFRDRFEELGGTVVVDRMVDPSVIAGASAEEGSEARVAAEEALDALLDEAAAATADVAFLPLESDVLRVLLPAWMERSALDEIPRLTTTRALGADLRAPELLAAESSLGLRIAAPVLEVPDAVSAVTGMSAAQTLERVVATSGIDDPRGWWAYAYDAATLLLRAIEDGSLVDVDGSLVLSRAELRGTVARTRFEGLTGPLRCTPTGDCAAPRIVIHAHEDPSAVDLGGLPIVATIDG